MKTLTQYISFFLMILLASCDKEITVNKENILHLDFIVQETDGSAIFLNKSSKSAFNYELRIGNDTIFKGALKDTLGIYQFKSIGEWEIVFSVSNFEGYKKYISKTVQIKKVKERTDVVSNQDIVLSKPEINISYMLLDSGGIQMFNNTQNVQKTSWFVSYNNKDAEGKNLEQPIISNQTSPKIMFDSNGEKKVGLSVKFKNGQVVDSVFTFQISNATYKTPFVSELKGIIYNEVLNLKAKSSLDILNPLIINGTPERVNVTKDYFIVNKDFEINISLFDYNKRFAEDVRFTKDFFKLGRQDLPKALFNQGGYGWGIFIGGKGTVLTLKDNESDSFEILEIEEVSQLKIIPEVEDKAFIVTFRLKGISKEFGKMDFTMKKKFIFYKF